MKKTIIILAALLTGGLLRAQSVPMALEDWKTNQGTQNFFYKNVTKTDPSGNVVVAGATMNNGTTDILVAKYNGSGNQLWIRQFAGSATNGVDFAAGLYVNATDVYLTGAISNNNSVPETDCVTMKLDGSTGSIIWSTSYSGAGGSHDAGTNINVDGSGNVYVSGGTYNASLNTDYLAIKYNSLGVQQWASTWDYAGADDGGIAVVIGGGSNINIAGAVTTPTPGVYKMATVRFANATGALLATNVSTAVTTSSVEAVTDMALDASGNILIAGSQDMVTHHDFYVQKLDGSTMASQWVYSWNGPSSLDDYAKAVAPDASGNVYVAGFSTSISLGRELTLIKLNSSGVNQWTQSSGLSGDDEAADLVVDANADVYVVGYKSNPTTQKNYYTAKYSTLGALIWEKEADGIAHDDHATNVALDSLNNVIVTGQSEISTNNYRFSTVKYVQMEVTNPVDLLNQPTNASFGYYANKGQILDETGAPASSVFYYTHHQNPDIFIEKNTYNYLFRRADTSAAAMDTLEKIAVSFVGCNTNAKPYGYDPKTYPINYLLGNIPELVTDVKGNDRVVTKNIYPNIDLHYYSNASGLKYYFVVNPGGQVKDIALHFSGANSTTLTANKLFIDGYLNDITLKRPYAYMVNGPTTTTLTGSSSWTNIGTDTFAISVPSYTPSQTLVIVIEAFVPSLSPLGTVQNLNYSTYHGGGGTDVFKDLKVTADNSRYVTGYTNSTNFPTLNGYSATHGMKDAVLLRYTPGDTLRFATYLGGNSDDIGNSIDVNATGEIFIGGKTASTNFPTSTNTGQANQQVNGGYPNYPGSYYDDGFISKLASTGVYFQFSRYYGGTRNDEINSICLDAAGNLHFTGYAFSTDIPMVNADQPSVGTWQTGNNCEAVVGKLNTSMAMVYNTYFGGTYAGTVTTITQDIGNDITIDGNGNAIVVGWSDCINLPVGNPNSYSSTFYQSSRKGPRDGFITRYSPSGAKQFSTWFGGNGIDEIKRVRYDAVNNLIYFAGESTDTTAFPFVTRGGAFNYRKKIAKSAFIGLMDGGLTKIWSSFYGKKGSFNVTGLAIDNMGLCYLSGYTSDSLNYPSTPPLLPVYVDTTAVNYDGFVAIFNLNQNLYHAHYFGGNGSDMINNSDIGSQKLYVIGNTQSTDFPISYASALIGAQIDSTANGGDDGFISRFDLSNYVVAGVEQVKADENGLSVYPNPANTMLNIRLDKGYTDQTQLKVYTIMGQLIDECEISSQITEVPCMNWANGVYLLNINNNQVNKTFKIIKQ